MRLIAIIVLYVHGARAQVLSGLEVRREPLKQKISQFSSSQDEYAQHVVEAGLLPFLSPQPLRREQRMPS